VIYSKVGDAICELGRFGQKVGKGWYDYEAGKREPVPSAEVQACIDKVRLEKGITARAISDEEIVGRLVLAMVNEGAQILEEGIANKASDIDMVYLTGYGFPLVWGGPMLYADLMGLPKVVDAMKQYQANPHDDQAFWTPAPLLLKLAQEGKTFTGVNL
jgi:3-hydroxyacyl-CoA dehydrogenase